MAGIVGLAVGLAGLVALFVVMLRKAIRSSR